MHVALTLSLWLAFAAGLCGWFCLVSDRIRLKPAFLPVVTLTSLTVILFTFGLFHQIHLASWGLFFAGLGLLVFYFVQAVRKRFSFSFLLSPGLIFFFVASALFIPILWGHHYYHYDNFSHWGTVLSEMLSFRDFPTAQTVVVFRDYAPGSTSFLYWFCTVIGTGEDVALMGQAMLSCAALSSLFFRVRKVRTFRFASYCILALTLICLLVYDDGTLQVYNLLVDALQGFVAVGAWFLREEYKDRPVFAWAMMTPVLTFLMLIKSNSGLLLAFFILFLLYDCWKRGPKKWKKLYVLLPLGTPFLWYFFWKIYRDLTYGTATNSYAFYGLIRTFIDRTPVFYVNLLKTFWEKVSDLSRIYMVVFLVLNLLAVGAILLLRYKKKDDTYLRKTLITANLLLLGYVLALLFMYGFIMAVGEARYLAAFERYVITPLIVFTAIIAESVITSYAHVLEDRPFGIRIIPVCVALLLFSTVSSHAVQLVSPPDFSSTERGQVIDVLQSAAGLIPRNSKVAMCNGERGRRDMYYYLMMFELKSRMCFVLDFAQTEESVPADVQKLKYYDYLVISSRHYAVVSSLTRAGYKVQWDKDCSVYRIKTMADGSIYIYPAKMVYSN